VIHWKDSDGIQKGCEFSLGRYWGYTREKLDSKRFYKAILKIQLFAVLSLAWNKLVGYCGFFEKE
jgi:hypothetical protein